MLNLVITKRSFIREIFSLFKKLLMLIERKIEFVEIGNLFENGQLLENYSTFIKTIVDDLKKDQIH